MPHQFTGDINGDYHKEVNDILIDEDKYLIRDRNGNPQPEGNGASFRVAVPLSTLYPDNTDFSNAQITRVWCERQGQPVDFMDWTYAKSCCQMGVAGSAEGLTGVCRGWWQNRGRHIKMTVDWQKLGFQCTAHPWKKENGKWQ